MKDEVPVKEPRKNKTPENIDQIVKDTEKYLDEVLRAMGLDPKLNLYYNRRDNVLNINVSGEKMGALIGKHGQTLDALQYLISLYVNKESDSFVKIKLDTENYRERRQQTLEKLAGSIAYKVKKNKKPIYLEPMNPNERRIIHSALQRDPEVITKSEGKDPYRKDVVKTEEEYFAKLREMIAHQLVPESDYKFSIDARAAIEKAVGEFDLPDAFLKRWLLATDKNRKAENIDEDFAKMVPDLKWQLIKEQIVKQFDIIIQIGRAIFMSMMPIYWLWQNG